MEEKPPVPDKLYKYFPDADYVFPNPTLRYTPRDLLNDPEEAIPSLENRFPIDFLADTARLAGLDKSVGDLEWLMEDLMRDDPETTFRRFSDLHRKGNLGVLSLSSDPLNNAMWGHYASSHRGVVFELDMEHACFGPREGFSRFRPVRYSDERPPGYVSSPQEMLPWYFTKSRHWEGEKEYRRITEITDRLNACPGVPGTVVLPPEAITAIYLGLNIGGGFLDKAVEYCRKHGIPCGKVRRDPRSYALHAPDFNAPL